MSSGTSSQDRRVRKSAWSEAERLSALRAYEILDTPRESDFDDLALIASMTLNAPMAVVNFIETDRQWFKAELGIGERELPLDVSICRHAILQEGVFVIPDLSTDERFADNPLVSAANGLRFYAGALLETAEGVPLGTLCVLDTQPRPHGLTEAERTILRVLARQVMAQLDLRKTAAQQRSKEERMRRILESAIDYAIISMDLTGHVTSWNEGARQIFGWTEQEMIGRRCDIFFTPEDRTAGAPDMEMGAALTHGRGSDERWHLRKNLTRFWASGEMMPLLEGDVPVGFLKILRDRSEYRQAQEALRLSEAGAERDRTLLTNEMEHRVKNTLSLVQAIVSQSLRNARSPAEARQAIEERLVSLGRAHDILTQTNWAAAPISEIIQAATAVHGSRPGQIEATGPDFEVSARAAVNLSLTLHELCTNASKYGALSVDGGHVKITWDVSGEGPGALFEIRWEERGGPPVLEPTRKGFGSRLIQSSLSGGSDGFGQIKYNISGVEWVASASLRSIKNG